jgi:hypothetical protein
MLTFNGFTGINNVVPSERLLPDQKTGLSALVEAMNVDIGLDNEVSRRKGYSILSDVCHKNVWQGFGFMLATVNSDLVSIIDGNETVIYPSLGVSRVWYVNLPDGRTAFSNGLINGITDGTTTTKWGVPLPAGVGSPTAISGALKAGRYRWQVTHVRTVDGLEGGATYGGTITLDADAGIAWTGLPVLADHSLNMYLSSHNDDVAYLAGNTTGSTFTFAAANDRLTLPCKTNDCYPAPAGILLSFYRGRALCATGNLLLASRNQQWELFEIAKDFKAFSGDVTAILPVDDGMHIGTSKELCFLQGQKFDELVYSQSTDQGVVLGSGVTLHGEQIKVGNGLGSDSAMLCICDGQIVAGFNQGVITRLTEGRYQTDATEVAATFRVQNGIPQYLAIAQ